MNRVDHFIQYRVRPFSGRNFKERQGENTHGTHTCAICGGPVAFPYKHPVYVVGGGGGDWARDREESSNNTDPGWVGIWGICIKCHNAHLMPDGETAIHTTVRHIVTSDNGKVKPTLHNVHVIYRGYHIKNRGKMSGVMHYTDYRTGFNITDPDGIRALPGARYGHTLLECRALIDLWIDSGKDRLKFEEALLPWIF